VHHIRVDCEMAESSHSSLDDLIRRYFEDGYTHNEIRCFLKIRHEVEMTPDQLRTRLKSMGLRRRGSGVESSLEDVQEAIIVSISIHPVTG